MHTAQLEKQFQIRLPPDSILNATCFPLTVTKSPHDDISGPHGISVTHFYIASRFPDYSF